MTRACKTCDFFHPFASDDELMADLSQYVGHDKDAVAGLSLRGFCRYNPPSQPWEVMPGVKSAFPDVHEREWCGHYLVAQDQIPANVA